MARTKIKSPFPENKKYFKRRFLNKVIRATNKHTIYFYFRLYKICIAKSGYRFTVLKLVRKHRGIPTYRIKIHVWENTNGEIRVGHSHSTVFEIKYVKRDMKMLYEHLLIH
jgi:hypothetical protein